MKAAVFSDTHGNGALMLEAVRCYRPDVVIHLGDGERDLDKLRPEFPEIAVYNVCGNCDFCSSAPLCDTVPLGPVKALITHGHTYGVDRGNDSLVYAAQEQNCRIAFYGHTHRPERTELGGVTVINPGSAGKGARPTWATVEVFDNGGFACSIQEL